MRRALNTFSRDEASGLGKTVDIKDDQGTSENMPSTDMNENCESDTEASELDESTNMDEDRVIIDDNSTENRQEESNDPDQSVIVRSVSVKLQPGQCVTYKDVESGQKCSGKVLGRAGKITGRNKNWYNIEYMEPDSFIGTKASVDMGMVENLETISDTESCITDEQTDVDDSIMMMDEVSFEEAKKAELDSWKRNNVYEEVEDRGQKCISTRWICTLKEVNEGIIPKARLVARGFEELDKDNIPKDSPTCSTEALRLVLSVFAIKHWKPHSIDIKTAFLQGSELTRDLYLRPPKEVNAKSYVWRLRKCVYGLSDASLIWYKKVCEVMIRCGAKLSLVDPAVFYWIDSKGEVIGILASHVDDFIWGGSQQFVRDVIPEIRKSFNIGREETDAFSYVGMEITSRNETILLSQQNYVHNLKCIHVDKARSAHRESLLTPVEMDALRSKIGQILWVARQTRPDVMFDACYLAASLKGAKVQNIIDANKVVGKLKSEDVVLKFQDLEDDLKLVIFSDASLGNLPDGGTQGGQLVMLMDKMGKFSPLYWNSKRIRRVVRSTLAGETLALADGIDSGIFIATLYAELTTGKTVPELLPVVCITDNHSLFDAIKSTKLVSDKRLRLEISSIKELIQKGQIKEISWYASKEQLADVLTKKGASSFPLLKVMSEGVWKPQTY